MIFKHNKFDNCPNKALWFANHIPVPKNNVPINWDLDAWRTCSCAMFQSHSLNHWGICVGIPAQQQCVGGVCAVITAQYTAYFDMEFWPSSYHVMWK